MQFPGFKSARMVACGAAVLLVALLLVAFSSARGQSAASHAQTASAPATAVTSSDGSNSATSGPASKPEAPIGLPTAPAQTFLPTANEPGMGNVLWQMFSSVLVILGLGAAAILIIKKVLPRLGLSAGGVGMGILRSGKMRILETVRLGQQRHVHLLEVQGRKFLLGDTRERITLLAEIAAGAESSANHAKPDEGQ
jgi:flagellar biogenesis protein FliO